MRPQETLIDHSITDGVIKPGTIRNICGTNERSIPLLLQKQENRQVLKNNLKGKMMRKEHMAKIETAKYTQRKMYVFKLALQHASF